MIFKRSERVAPGPEKQAEWLAWLLVTACAREEEPIRTVVDLASVSGYQPRTFQRKCALYGFKAKALLDFVTCARLVLDSYSYPPVPTALFPDVDPRTAERLARVGGLITASRPHFTEFLARQGFIIDAAVIQKLQERMQIPIGATASPNAVSELATRDTTRLSRPNK